MKLTEAITIKETVYLVDSPSQGLTLSNGQEPKFLFRVIDPGEWEEAQKNGYLSPSKFYGRIHASITPERKYGHRDSVSIAIQYRKQDGWKTKTNIDGDVYAVTDKNISLSIVRDISGGI